MTTVTARVEFEIKDWEIIVKEGQWKIWYAPEIPQPYYKVWRDAIILDLSIEKDRKKQDRDYNTRYVRDMRRSRKEQGLCPMCGSERDRDNRSWCSLCADGHNRRDRLRRLKTKRGK